MATTIRLLTDIILSGVPYKSGDLVSITDLTATQLVAGKFADDNAEAIARAVTEGEIIQYPDVDAINYNRSYPESINRITLSPANTADQNTALIQGALNLGGLVNINGAGTVFISSTPIIYNDTYITINPNLTIKIKTGNYCNFGINSNWASPVNDVTSLTPSVVNSAGQQGLYALTIASDIPNVKVNDFVILKGDINNLYNGIHRVVGINPGASVTVHVKMDASSVAYPQFTKGTTPSGVGSFKLANSGSAINKAPGSGYIPANPNTSFYALISGGDGYGAIAQIDCKAGVIQQVLVAEPGFGYTNFTGATIDLSVGGGSASVPLSDIATPLLMSIALANGNITVDGGTWDWNQANSGTVTNPTINRHGFIFNKVANLTVKNMEFVNVDYYSLYYSNLQNFRYENIIGKCASLGQGVGPVWGGKISNIRGQTTDDFMGIGTANGTDPVNLSHDYSAIDLPDTNGLVDLDIDGVYSDRCNNMTGIFPCRGFPISVRMRNYRAGGPSIQAKQYVIDTNASNAIVNAAPTINTNFATGLYPGMTVVCGGVKTSPPAKIVSIARGSSGAYGGYNHQITLTQNNNFGTGDKKILYIPPKRQARVSNFFCVQAYGLGDALANEITLDGFSGETRSFHTNVIPSVSGSGGTSTLTINKMAITNGIMPEFKNYAGIINVQPYCKIQDLYLGNNLYRLDGNQSPESDNHRNIVDNYGEVKKCTFFRCSVENYGSDYGMHAFTNAPSGKAGLVDFIGCTATNLETDANSTFYFAESESSANVPTFNFTDNSQISGGGFISGGQSANINVNGLTLSGTFNNSPLRLYSASKTYNLTLANISNNTSQALLSNGGNTINLLAGDGTAKITLSDLSRSGSAGAMCKSATSIGTILANNLAVCDATGAAGSWKQVSNNALNY